MCGQATWGRKPLWAQQLLPPCLQGGGFGEEFFEVEVGLELVEDVAVGAGEEEGGLEFGGEFSDVVGEDLGGDSVEGVGELVDGDEFRSACERESQFEAEDLAVGQFGWGTQEELGVGESGLGEEVQGLVEGEVCEMVGQDFFGVEAQAVEVEVGLVEFLEDSEEA